MKNLTNHIKENNQIKNYNYTVTVEIEGVMKAENESDAGEKIDKEIDMISNVSNYEINSVDEIDSEPMTESLLNDNEQEIVDQLYNSVINLYTESLNKLHSDYNKAMLETKISQYFNK